MGLDKVVFSTGKDDWGTPKDLFNELDQEFNFTLDPCGNKNWILKRDITIFYESDNGLIQPWKDHRVFVNPPYSQIDKWIKKSYDEWNKAKLIVMLIPIRTDRKIFHQYVYNKAQLRFIQGRLRFVDCSTGRKSGPAPFPAMLCIFRKEEYYDDNPDEQDLKDWL